MVEDPLTIDEWPHMSHGQSQIISETHSSDS